MLSVALVPMLVVLGGATTPAPSAAVTAQAKPPVRVWLDDRNYKRGDQANVHVEVRDDGYLIVMHLDADGRLRVLFPLDPTDDNFVRGGRDLEVRGRGDRDPIEINTAHGGTGYVFAATSADPFRFDQFAVNDHWDYRYLGDSAMSQDPEQGLVNIVSQMADNGAYKYDVVTYDVEGQVAESQQPENSYSSGYGGSTWYGPAVSVGFGYAAFGFGFGPAYYCGYCAPYYYGYPVGYPYYGYPYRPYYPPVYRPPFVWNYPPAWYRPWGTPWQGIPQPVRPGTHPNWNVVAGVGVRVPTVTGTQLVNQRSGFSRAATRPALGVPVSRPDYPGVMTRPPTSAESFASRATRPPGATRGRASGWTAPNGIRDVRSYAARDQAVRQDAVRLQHEPRQAMRNPMTNRAPQMPNREPRVQETPQQVRGPTQTREPTPPRAPAMMHSPFGGGGHATPVHTFSAPRPVAAPHVNFGGGRGRP